MSDAHRWSKFWWQDWQRDEGLRACSLAAQGLWMRLLCIAHEALPRGHVLINGKPPSIKRLALLANTTGREIIKLLSELEQEGVFSRTDDGTIYSRRMIKDVAASDAGREAITKRWKNHEPSSPPNRVPTSKPNGVGHSPPTSHPNTQEAEADSEAEAEETKKVIYKNPLSPDVKDNAVPREDEAASNEISEETDGQRVEFVGPPSANPLVSAHIQRTSKACEMRVPYAEVRDRGEQTDGLESTQPALEEAPTPWRYRPVDPVRSPVAMMAELLGISFAEAEMRFPHAMAAE